MEEDINDVIEEENDDKVNVAIPLMNMRIIMRRCMQSNILGACKYHQQILTQTWRMRMGGRVLFLGKTFEAWIAIAPSKLL